LVLGFCGVSFAKSSRNAPVTQKSLRSHIQWAFMTFGDDTTDIANSAVNPHWDWIYADLWGVTQGIAVGLVFCLAIRRQDATGIWNGKTCVGSRILRCRLP
jgi:hypothetical protein